MPRWPLGLALIGAIVLGSFLLWRSNGKPTAAAPPRPDAAAVSVPVAPPDAAAVVVVPDAPAPAPPPDASPPDASPPPDSGQPAAWARVEIGSFPTGATIFVNGRRLGEAPVKYRWKQGETIVIKAELEGYLPWTKRLLLDQPLIDVTASLKKAP